MASTYYGVAGDVVWKLRWQHTSTPLERQWYHQPRLIRESEQVWYQGPRGGVKLVKDSNEPLPWHSASYLRQDSEKMKQFAWIKLRAKALKQS